MRNTENTTDHKNLYPVPDYEIDATDLSCPLPLLKMKQTLNRAKTGEVILVKATDSASQRDFEAYIQMTPHQLVQREKNGQFLFWISKRQEIK